MKLIIQLIFLLAFTACVGGGGESTSKNEQVQNIAHYTIQTSAPAIFEGETLTITIKTSSVSSPRSIYWEIIDDQGQIATPYFFSDSGSDTILIGESEKALNIYPRKNIVPLGGKLFMIKIYIDQQTYTRTLLVKNLFDASDDPISHSITLSSYADNGVVNLSNHTLYTVGGSCSTVGGAVVVTASNGTSTVSKQGVCPDSKEWYIALNLSGLSDGVVNIKAQHSLGGLPGEATGLVTKDTTAPTVSILTPAANSGIKLINKASFSLTGACSEDNQNVKIQIHSASGGSINTTTICFAGSWSTALDLTSINDGNITASVRHFDSVGNEHIVSRSFVKDTVVPTLTIETPEDGFIANSSTFQTISLSGFCSENFATISLNGDIENVPSIRCTNQRWTFSQLKATGIDGPKFITAIIADSVGNVSYDTINFMKMTEIPVAEISNMPETRDQKLNIKIGGPRVDKYKYKLGDTDLDCTKSSDYSAWISVTENIIDDLGVNGDKKICVVGRDIYGNAQGFSVATSYNWTKNTSAPVIVSFTSPAANSIIASGNVASFTLNGTCQQSGTNVYIKYSADADTVEVACIDNAWTATLDLSALADGAVKIEAEHNGDVAIRTFQKYMASPSIAFTSPVAGSYISKLNRSFVEVSGTCNAFSETPNITITGASSTVTTACNGETWSAYLAFADNKSEIVTLTAILRDRLGVEGATTHSLVLDTLAPTVAITFPEIGSFITSSSITNFALGGTCSDNGNGVVQVLYSSDVLSTTDCIDNAWSANVNLTDLLDGYVTLSTRLTDPAGNISITNRVFEKVTFTPYVNLNNTPDAISDKQKLNIYVSGFQVTSYRFKIGDSDLDCSVDTGYSSPVLISQPITNDLGVDGHKKICVIGQDLYGNMQAYDEATTHTWIKEANPPHVEFLSPAENSFILLSNQSAFEITGTCAINGSNRVTIQGSFGSRSIDCTDNRWSTIIDFTSVLDGEITIKAIQTSFFTSAVGEATRKYHKLTVLPTIAFVNPPANSYINKLDYEALNITGTCNAESDAPNIVVEGGSTPVEAVCDGENWSAVLAFSDNVERTVELNVKITDRAGQQATATHTLLLDTIDPTATFTTEDALINTLNMAAFPINGGCSDNGVGLVTIFTDGNPLATVDCVNNLWNATVDVRSSLDGDVVLEAVHSDLAGNLVAAIKTFQKDTYIPSAALSNLPDPISEATEISIVVEGLNIDTYMYKLGDNTLDCTIGDDYIGPRAAGQRIEAELGADGHYKVCVVGKTANENSQPFSDASVYQWIKETVLPGAQILTPAAGSFILSADEEAFTLTGSCVLNGTANVKVEVAPINVNVDCIDGAWTATLNLKNSVPDGQITVKASQTSSLTARVGESSRTFTKYTAQPYISFTTPAANSYINKANFQNFNFSGTCNSASDLPNIVILGGSSAVEATCDGDTWNAVLSFPDELETNIGLTATITDIADQTASASRSFILDTIAPTATFSTDPNTTFINNVNKGAFEISGSCSDHGDDSVNIHIDGTPLRTIDCIGNLWSTTLDLSLKDDGTIAISAIHSDPAGNTTTVTENFVKDTFIPTAMLSGLPEEVSEDASLYVQVGGTNVDTYYYKIGDWTLNCAIEDDYIGPISISTPITDSLGADGNKKICVLGQTVYENRQSLAGATSYSWKKESTRPFAYFSTPEENAYILISNQEAFALTGTCVVNGTNNVKIQYGTQTVNVNCTDGAWSAVVDLTDMLEGDVIIKASQTSELTGLSGESERKFIKFTTQPVIAFTSPAVGALINRDNYQDFAISGTCNANSEDPNILVEGGEANVEVICIDGEWSANIALAADIEDPNKEIKVTLTDKAGQSSFATRTFNLDTLAPTISITSEYLINLTNVNNFPIAGTCSENGTDNIIVRINEVEIKTIDCLLSLWSTTLDVSAYTDGDLYIDVIQTDAAGNTTKYTQPFYKDTFTPTATIAGAPSGESEVYQLNVTVGGTKVTAYYYKFGNIDDMGYCFDGGYSGPFSIEQPITDLVGEPGEKMLCVRGVSINGNTQSESGATRVSWTKLPGDEPPPEDPEDPEEPGEPGDGEGEGDSLLAWTYPFDGICVGDGNASGFFLEGQCSEGNGNVTITSPYLANSPVVMSCEGGEFGGEVDLNIAELNNGDLINLTLTQIGLSESKTLKVKVGKYDAENPPTIVFGGWKDVYATGIKTYANSEEEEPGQVWIRWNEWPESNTCQPQGINVLRSIDQASMGTPLITGDDLLDHDEDSFEDKTLGDEDFGKAYYYRLRVRISGVDFDVPASVHNPQLRVITPPQDMTLVHRWVANQAQCLAFGQIPDPANNYRCGYDTGKFFDLKHDLLVDRQEMGCNVSWTCATSDGACAGDASNILTTGIPAPIGSVWFDDQSEDFAGTCWYKTGPADTDWTYAPMLTSANDLRAVSSASAHLPPFVSIEQAKASNVCNAHEVSVSGVTEYSDNSANTFPMNKRLLTQTEWRAAAEWDDKGEDREDLVRDLELGDVTGACNTRYSSRDMNDQSLYSQIVITGSNVTENCLSRYGIQDMIGNAWEWVSDQVTCSGGSCTGITGYAFSSPYNSTSGPIEISNSHHMDILYGLPRTSPAPGSIEAIELPFMDNATFNINNANGVRPMRLGGSWNGEAGFGSRWTTDLSLGITVGEDHYEEEWDTSFRCMVPIK